MELTPEGISAELYNLYAPEFMKDYVNWEGQIGGTIREMQEIGPTSFGLVIVGIRDDEQTPAGFKGHSLSVSDVVVLRHGDRQEAHYCDDVGFQEVPEFLRENPPRTAELSTEQNENMIDGVLNNAPPPGGVETKEKAGESVTAADTAKGKENKPKKPRKATQKKSSIRAQLKAAKEGQQQKSPAKEKSQDLEV